MSDNTPGWQPDPMGKHDHRYWDGAQWTDNVADGGVAATDPYEAPAVSALDEPVADAPTPQPEPPAAGEPTVVQPVAAGPDATAAWPTDPARPAVPPPYVPPLPAGSGGSDGSKRGLLVGGGILAAVAIAIAAFLMLGGDDGDDVRTQLASTIEREVDGVSERQSECVADLLVDEGGEDAFKDTDFDTQDAPPEFNQAVDDVGAATLAEECGVDEEAFGGTDGSSTDSADGGTDDGGQSDLDSLRNDCADGDFVACDDLYFSADLGSDLETFGSTCGGIADPQNGFCEETNGGEIDPSTTDGFSDGNLEDIIADSYEDAFNISREQAECLADKVATAIDDGSLSEDQAMSEIFDYLEECDISLDEIGAN